VGKGVAYAETVEVLHASVDRRQTEIDWRCGGSVYAHIDYGRQTTLKGEIIADAFGRLGRIPLKAPEVMFAAESGYRMRARLHVHNHRIGFYREGSHALCDAAATQQLLPETGEWITGVEALLRRDALDDILWIELAENVAADERACHLALAAGASADRYAVLTETADVLTGLSAQAADTPVMATLSGTPFVTDVLAVGSDSAAASLRLTRDVRAFFQGNRYLLDRLLGLVLAALPDRPVVDLYAGVGLFGLAAAASGREVTLVEGDPISSADLDRNAAAFPAAHVEHRSVETFLSHAAAQRRVGEATLIVDPPRTGLSRVALGGIVACAPARIVYVSCDVATLARDARMLLDANYGLESLVGVDLFPNTAHVESVATFTRA
jgi:23S rRNA (uracil1939-C5)-methyltransferase